jgi:hypothetical protein
MGFYDIDSFKGKLSQQYVYDPTIYERTNYIKILGGMR